MSKKYVISDLHLGHKNIIKFSGALRGGANVEEHDLWIMDQWNSVVTKHDLVYVLGDVAMNRESLEKVKRLKGNKLLVRGNHDVYNTKIYLEYFQEVWGFLHHKGVFWMSHAPIHPQELRGKFNLHGHVHQNSIPDDRYINCCVDAHYGIPQDLDALVEKYRPLIPKRESVDL